MSQIRYQLNQPQVVAETFGDEIIAVNFDTGSYYSIDKSGATVWKLVSAGATFSEIIAEIRKRYIGEQPVMEQAIQQFIHELQQAQLIVAHTNGTSVPQPETGQSAAPALGAKVQFEPPLLCEYGDMQDLLLLDPIHEVDDAGWPQRKVA